MLYANTAVQCLINKGVEYNNVSCVKGLLCHKLSASVLYLVNLEVVGFPEGSDLSHDVIDLVLVSLNVTLQQLCVQIMREKQQTFKPLNRCFQWKFRQSCLWVKLILIGDHTTCSFKLFRAKATCVIS